MTSGVAGVGHHCPGDGLPRRDARTPKTQDPDGGIGQGDDCQRRIGDDAERLLHIRVGEADTLARGGGANDRRIPREMLHCRGEDGADGERQGERDEEEREDKQFFHQRFCSFLPAGLPDLSGRFASGFTAGEETTEPLSEKREP